MAGLALLAAWRIGEEEIPRIALLTAAFFVTSSIHVKLGPTSVHLLLNGLVGVLLGWRAPLAILIGVTLQALLIPHGGLSTIGVNALTETLPALLVAGLFPLLHAGRDRVPWLRSLLIAISAVLWGVCLIGGVSLLATNPLRGLIGWSPSAGLVIALDDFAPTMAVLKQPVTLLGLGLFAVAGVHLERRAKTAPEFPLGVFLGMLSVLATVLLTGAVLLADGADRWGTFVSAVFIVHLPVALLEGLILGCMLGFLARVKPEMLSPMGNGQWGTGNDSKEEQQARVALPVQQRTGMMTLLALGLALLSARPALAHRLDGQYKIDRTKHQVTIESWYETGTVPTQAKVRVVRGDGSVLAEGPLDGNGTFVFTYDKQEALRVQITAPGGHAKELTIPADELTNSTEEAAIGNTREPRNLIMSAGNPNRGRDLLLGLGFLLSLSSFVMSWLTSRRLRKLAEVVERR
jgi:cobalt/nickel transport system permease protein